MMARALEDLEIANLSNGRGTLSNECCDVFRKQCPGYIVRDVPNNLGWHMDDEFVGGCSEAMFVSDLVVHGESSRSIEAVWVPVIRGQRQKHGSNNGNSMGVAPYTNSGRTVVTLRSKIFASFLKEAVSSARRLHPPSDIRIAFVTSLPWQNADEGATTSPSAWAVDTRLSAFQCSGSLCHT